MLKDEWHEAMSVPAVEPLTARKSTVALVPHLGVLRVSGRIDIDCELKVGMCKWVTLKFHDRVIGNLFVDLSCEIRSKVIIRAVAMRIRPQLQRVTAYLERRTDMKRDIDYGHRVGLRLRDVAGPLRSSLSSERCTEERRILIQWCFRQEDLSLATHPDCDVERFVARHHAL